MRTFRASRGRRLVAIAAVALLVAACGSAAPSATTAPAAVGRPGVPTSGTVRLLRARRVRVPAASAPAAAAACGTYAGPPVTITYAMWGDTTELANQQKIVDAFQAMNPNITVKVTVADWDSYWPKLQTDLAGGNAPDVFLMDGPLYPDYQTRDQLLDLTPFIARDGFDTGQLVDLAVQDFTAPDGHLYGLPRDLNTIALFYNKAMFDAAGLPYPDATWDWAKLVEVATKLTKTTDGKTSQWGFYTETTDMENYWSSLVWQAGGDILEPGQADGGHRHRPGGGRHPVPPGPHLQGQGHAAARARRHGRRVRERPGRHGGERLVAGPDPRGGGHRLRRGAAPEGAGRPGDVGQPERRRRLQGHEVARRGLGVHQVLHGPGAAGDGRVAQGVDAGQQAGPDRPVRDLVRRRQDVRRCARLRPPQAVVQGLRRVQHDAPGRAGREGLQRQRA